METLRVGVWKLPVAKPKWLASDLARETANRVSFSRTRRRGTNVRLKRIRFPRGPEGAFSWEFHRSRATPTFDRIRTSPRVRASPASASRRAMPHPTPGALGAFPGQWLPDELLEENPRGKARRDAPAAMGDGSFAGSRDAREVPKVRLAPRSPNDACFRVTARARPTATLPARRHPERAPRRASCAPRGDDARGLNISRPLWAPTRPKSGASQRHRPRRVFRRSSGTTRFRRGASREDASATLRGTRLASPPPPRRTPRASRASVAEPAAKRLPSRARTVLIQAPVRVPIAHVAATARVVTRRARRVTLERHRSRVFAF